MSGAAGDINVVGAAQLARVRDRGGLRRGREQGLLDLLSGGAVAIRQGRIAAVGSTREILDHWGDSGVATLDASGKTVLPGLIESHCHPLFEAASHPPDAGRALAGGVTTLECKTGYTLTVEGEARDLRLLREGQALTAVSLVPTFLGAHMVPADADGWGAADGWRTAVERGAVTADHLTFTSDAAIADVGTVDTVATLLPLAEMIYMTERRANARALIEHDVPVAIATDYCSSIGSSSLTTTIGVAVPWFALTPAEAIVGATLNAAYGLGLGADRGSIDVGKRGDLTILDATHPNDIYLALGEPRVSDVVIGGELAMTTEGAACGSC